MQNGGFFMREIITIQGGCPLFGTVEVPSAKNSILPLLAASVLCKDVVRFLKVPMLSDVVISTNILNYFGFLAKRANNEVIIVPREITNYELPSFLSEQMRASVLFLAPMLSRFGKVKAGMPGGCNIGMRPIDIHLDGLLSMGAIIEQHPKSLVLKTPNGLHGVDFTLRYPSVGATETLIMAAVLAKGQTILRGVAREPEIIDLANFLNVCGAKIKGAGKQNITIEGVDELCGATYTAMPDRIFAATIACAVAATSGEVKITNCAPKTYLPVLNALSRAGCCIKSDENSAVVSRFEKLNGIGQIVAGVYPEFPTDAAPLLAAALLCAKSSSYIKDQVFENRFACEASFRTMDAKTCVNGRTLAIYANEDLNGANVFASDLRGGAALIIAALGAQGQTNIENIHFIGRGYEDIVKTFYNLGGKINKNSYEMTK